MKNLILDVDGVIVDLITPLLDTYNKRYKTNFEYNDITDYNLSTTLTYFDISHLNDYLLYKCFKFMDDRIPAMLNALTHKYNIYFVTSVPLLCQNAIMGRIDWFKEYLYKQSNSLQNLVFSHHKNIIFDNLPTVIVDDCIDILEKSVLVFDKQIVFNQPWNQEEKTFTRVNNWNELYKELMEY